MNKQKINAKEMDKNSIFAKVYNYCHKNIPIGYISKEVELEENKYCKFYVESQEIKSLEKALNLIEDSLTNEKFETYEKRMIKSGTNSLSSRKDDQKYETIISRINEKDSLTEFTRFNIEIRKI